LGSSSSKKARATSTYSVTMTATGTSFLADKFPGPCPEDRPQASHRAATSGQSSVRLGANHRIERALVFDHAGDDGSEPGRIGRTVLLAIDFMAEPVRFIFGDDLEHAGAADIHLIERLHRRQPCCAALVGRLVSGIGGCSVATFSPPICLSARSYVERRAGRETALVEPVLPDPLPGLFGVLGGHDAVAKRQAIPKPPASSDHGPIHWQTISK
jgi:hypothetical protein